MSEPIRLKDVDPRVDKERIGISYSGGGPQVLIELGVVQAFIDLKIRPDVIAGASAGALAGTAHALDPVRGQGVQLATRLLGQVSARTLKLDPLDFVERLIAQRARLQSLGDNSPLGPMVDAGIQNTFGVAEVTVGYFKPPDHPRLLIAGTDRIDGTTLWFPDSTRISDALIATSAIPGVFPWRVQQVDGKRYTLVDGGVIHNQPVSQLALEGCGTIFVCAVGYGGGDMPPPTNALDNTLPSIFEMMHQAMKLEEEYVRLKLGKRADIHHIHPQIPFPVQGYSFTPALIQQVLESSRAATVTWLKGLGY